VGVRFEESGDVALEVDARRVRGLRTARGFVPASIVINAAGAWAGALGGVPLAARIAVAPVIGEMLAIAVPHGFARALIWHGSTYLVPRRDGRLLVGATVVERGFDARVTAMGVHQLLSVALAVAPTLADFSVVESWAGLRPGSSDGRPFLGATPIDGYLVAAGHYRNGILLAPITARAIADLVLNGRSDVALTPFSPGRGLPESRRAVAKTTS
jgi:glycine oxidase